MFTGNLRRLRKSSLLRKSINETQLNVSQFILPYFVVVGTNIRKEIPSMPGIFHLSIDALIKDLEDAQKKGIASILLFGLADEKDAKASGAFASNGITQEAVRVIKKEFPELVVYTDVCMCAFTIHGHCGLISDTRSGGVGMIDHEASVEVLAKTALSHAEAGADFVAPSAMMDNQVKAIRERLDQNGFKDVGILAYSAKYASSFYGPFREALDSAPQFGDRKAYQLDFRNSQEAIREIEQDIDQGADIVMVKPALAYLDIIARARERFKFPIAAYNVSGEYSMIKKSADGDKNIEKELALEVLYSIKRAGADIIISYFGKEVKQWLT